MANLKKVLAGSLSLCLAASMFTACGSSDSSSATDAKGGAAHQRLATAQVSTTALTE